MKRHLIGVFVLAAFLTWGGFQGQSQAADPVVTWRVQIPFSPGFWQHKASQLWAEEISKMTGGRMKIDLRFPVFDAYPEVISTVQGGELDAGYTWLAWAWGIPSAPVLKKYPAAILFAGTPAFLDLLGYYTWMYAYGGKELLQEVFGNTLIAMPAGMFWAKTGGWSSKKIESLSDMKGQKVRTDDTIWKKILSEAGGSPVEIFHPGQTRDDFAKGMVDALDFSTPWQDMSGGYQKYAKYCYFPGLQQIAGFFVFVVHPEKWNDLPPDMKEIIKGACDGAMAKSLTNWLLDDARAVKLLKDQGKVTITKLTKEVQQEILDKFVEQYEAVQDPMFQKVWKSQKEFMKIYVPYMKLQQVEAEVKLK